MTRIWDFHGGIHPPENKQQSLQRPLGQTPLPKTLVLPLAQHIGAPSDPLVKVGDRVLKGQIIAEPVHHVSAYLHAPTSGTIVAIESRPIPHPSGMAGTCIVLESDGQDEWIEHQGVEDYRKLEKHQLADLIRRAGIAGMGGAGFPTDVKLHLSDDHIINTLILNGVECEPYITADDMLMRLRAEEIIGGLEIAAHLLNPTHCLIGIEDNKPEAAKALNEAAQRSRLNVDVVILPTKYPSGGEKQLIKRLTGVEVPSGTIPADVGIVCQNVGTAQAVYRAVIKGEPLISRITTLTGEALSEPQNLEVLIGTPVSELLTRTKVRQRDIARLIMGGPMMGYSIDHADLPVVKTSNCIIAATESEFPPAPPAQACIRCGACEQACPAELLPQQLYWFARGRELDKAKRYNLLDCIECGACAYVCPSNIPLVQYYRFAKGEIRREQQEQQKAEQARQRFEARQARLEREKLEKEQRRKERAAAAAQAQADKRPATSVPAASKAPSGGDDQIKQLKTQAAVARTKLKKAQKALSEAEAAGSAELGSLRSDVQALEAKVSEAQKALEAAESNQPKADSATDIKALKTAAAVARTKVKKTEKALADAEEKGLPSADKLREGLKTLVAKAEAAQQALDAAEKAQQAQPASGAPDLKALKTAAAVARTKVKKTEKALADAQAKGLPGVDKLKDSLADLQAKSDAAQQALEAAEKAQQVPTQADSAAPADIKSLKTAAAVARTKLKKAQKALQQAQDEGLDTQALQAEVTALEEKSRQAQQAFEAAEQAQAAETTPSSEAATELAELREAYQVALGKVEKTQKTLQDAEAKGMPNADKLRKGLQGLQAKADAAKQALDKAERAAAVTSE